jgi:hypothetical protein
MQETFTPHQLVALEWRFGKDFPKSPEFKEWWKTEANNGKRKDFAIIDLHEGRRAQARNQMNTAI